VVLMPQWYLCPVFYGRFLQHGVKLLVDWTQY
jgi:hypothetical protein